MKILTIGAGFVGAAHSAVVANNGHEVLAYDIDKAKIADFKSMDAERIDRRIFEKGLAKLVQRNARKLRFTSDLEDVAKVIDETDVIFMCLPTPAYELNKPLEDRFLFRAGKDLAGLLKERNEGAQDNRVVIVNKSTVPIGTAGQLKDKLYAWGVRNFGVGSNPEFLVEGEAVEGSMNPDRVVLGIENAGDGERLRQLYKHLSPGKLKLMSPSSAESVKLLANFELYQRIISYFHLSRLCEENPEMNYEDVVAGITADKRLPKWGHYVSLYAGGSCFDKDARNLRRTFREMKSAEHAVKLLDWVIEGNMLQLERFYKRAETAGFSFEGKRIALLGQAFKKDTNDVRMSPAIPLTEWLHKDGAAEIRAYDPQATTNYAEHFEGRKESEIIVPVDSAAEAINATDALIIATDWDEFRHSADILKERDGPYLIMDGRRSLRQDYSDLAKRGYTIIAVGSPFLGAE